MVSTATKTGKIVQIIGSTFDVEFEEGHLPAIYNALTINQKTAGGTDISLTGEVQQHLGGSRVRCVALGSTDGLVRGMDAEDTGAPVSVPVGLETLGRVFNLLGQPIDGGGPVKTEGKRSIHREPLRGRRCRRRLPRHQRSRSRGDRAGHPGIGRHGGRPPVRCERPRLGEGCCRCRRRELRPVHLCRDVRRHRTVRSE